MLDRIKYFLSPKVLLPMAESPRQKIVRGLREIPIEVKRFLARRYPSFVTAGSPVPSCSEVPVFMFHKVSPSSFEEQLHFLKQNRYRTLSLEKFLSFLNGSLRLASPSVLITFDDGDKSLYTAAFPLLQKYDFQAVAFVVPGCIRETPATARASDWVCWSELAEMDQSGVVDVQSHSYYHDQIFIGPELLDFYHSRFDSNPLRLDTPWLDDGETYTNRLPLGTPVYRHAPSLAGHRRYFDVEPVRRACIAFVEEKGGAAFFADSNWRRKLGRFYYRQVAGRSAGYESREQQAKRILADLVLARRVLEERLHKPVRHLCYPWGQGSELAVVLSRQAGYESNFWVIPPGKAKLASPYHIPRIKDDYLFRLPGRGRKSLARIFRGKLRRRRQTLDLY